MAAEKKQSGNGKFSGEMVRIKIGMDSSEAGKQDVTVGVEGRVLQIKRGQVVEIPVEHYDVLSSREFTDFSARGEANSKAARFAISRM